MRVVFNGYEISDDFHVLCDSRDMPEFDVPTTKVEGVDGLLVGTPSLNARELTVTLVARKHRADRMDRATERLMKALRVEEPSRLYFSDEKDADGNRRYRLAMPTGVVSSHDYINGRTFEVTFIQPDPYLYGEKRSVVIKKQQTKAIKVGGNMPTWWVATSTPKSGSEYALVRVDPANEWVVQFDAPFDGNHMLELNERKLTAKLFPAMDEAAGLSTSSRFEPIEGRVELWASHETTLEWYERWLA